MTLMPAVKRFATLILFFSALVFSLSAQAKGENLFIFVFKDGVAQADIKVKVGGVDATTNEFGTASFSLPAGDYEVGYYQADELFALTELTLQSAVSSQIFLSLKQTGAEVELDLPLSSYQQEFEHQQLKEQTGPKGTLSLKVVDLASQQVVAGAKLFFKGYAVEAQTNEQGIATVELSEGKYDISVVHPKYVMQVSKDLKIKANLTTESELKLIKADIVLDEYVVSAPFVEGSLASNIADLKNSDVVGDAISSEQFSKAGDSDAAGALKRVTGITVVDGKFVYVRGLGERYTTVLLNSLEVPSPEPTKRVVPLDIFPAGVIQSMDIQKTYSSELPGTFGGGTILINTKDIPKEDNYISGSIGVTVHDSTGEEMVSNPDNDKPLPALLIRKSEGFQTLQDEVRIGDNVLVEGLTAAERQELDSSMVNYRNYGLKTTKLAPGTSLSTSFGQSFKSSGGMKYGFAGNLYYKNEEKSRGITEERDFQSENGVQTLDKDTQYEKAVLNEKVGGLLSFGFEPTKSHKLKYTFVGLNESEDQTKFSQSDDVVENSSSEKVLLRYTEKEMFSHQLNGEHAIIWDKEALFSGLDISWGASNSTATRIEPGTFEYVYKDAASGNGMVIDKNKMFYQYSDLEDTLNNYRLDLDFPFRLNGRANKISIGIYQLNKERSLDNRRFKFNYSILEDSREIDEILTESVALTNKLDITSNYRQDDAYSAEQELSALYLSATVSPLNSLDIFLGARQERSTQDLEVGILAESRKSYSLETSDLLPFLNTTYRLNDEHQFRFGASKTLTRPDFREFSPTRYKDPETDYVVRGFPELTYSEITNIDLKYEWFPSFDEFFSFGVFSKEFINPIETVRSRPDEDIEISYVNAEGASSIGFELGFRKKLTMISESLENFFVEGNFAYISSEVNLDPADIISYNLTTNERSMQGQSPYVTNFKFGYDNFFTRRSAMFLYNVYGKRISALGINGTPDVYEQPFHRLDFVVKWGLNDTYDDQIKRIGYSISLKLKNLLDSEVEERQGGEVVKLYYPGRSASFSFSVKY